MNRAGLARTPKEQWEKMLSDWHLKTRGYSHPPGRNDLPHALADLYADGMFNKDDWAPLQAIALEDAWISAEFPALAIDIDAWFDLFDEVGFIENGKVAERPTSIPKLYRAAVEGVTGLSWTESRELAEWFHQRNIEWGLPAVLLELNDIDPFAVLAHFHDEENGRAEHEWVITPGWEDWE